MKTATRALGVLAVAAMAMTSLAQDRTGVDRQYAKWKKAYWNESYSQAISVFGTNFTWIKPMGEKVGYREYAAGLKKMMSLTDLEFKVVDMKNDSYSFTGNEAQVRSNKHISYSQRINGRMVTAHVHMDTVDTWRRGPGGWKLFKVQVLSQENENDG